MKDRLRRRREKHLLLLRLGTGYRQRVRQLAREFDVSESAIESDEHRLDTWIDDVATTASFEKKASFLLHQHRSQTEALEQLGWNARERREDAEGDVEEVRERIAEVEAIGPEGFEDEDDYWNTLVRLYRRLDSAKTDVFKWAREERQVRNDGADNIEQEFEMRQSLGDIEQVADELHIREEREVSERKVIVGFDAFEELPGLDRANLVGAEFDGPAPDLDGDAVGIDLDSPGGEDGD